MVFLGQRKHGWINRQESKLSSVIEIAVYMGIVNRSLQIAVKKQGIWEERDQDGGGGEH